MSICCSRQEMKLIFCLAIVLCLFGPCFACDQAVVGDCSDWEVREGYTADGPYRQVQVALLVPFASNGEDAILPLDKLFEGIDYVHDRLRSLVNINAYRVDNDRLRYSQVTRIEFSRDGTVNPDKYCSRHYLGDGECDQACNSDFYFWDFGDCPYFNIWGGPPCPDGHTTNGRCDSVCNKKEHGYDGGECCDPRAENSLGNCRDPSSPNFNYVDTTEAWQLANGDHYSIDRRLLTIVLVKDLARGAARLNGFARNSPLKPDPDTNDPIEVYVKVRSRDDYHSMFETMAHELGHALGLRHTHSGNPKESPSAKCCPDLEGSSNFGDFLIDTAVTPSKFTRPAADAPFCSSGVNCDGSTWTSPTDSTNLMSYDSYCDVQDAMTEDQFGRMYCLLDRTLCASDGFNYRCVQTGSKSESTDADEHLRLTRDHPMERDPHEHFSAKFSHFHERAIPDSVKSSKTYHPVQENARAVRGSVPPTWTCDPDYYDTRDGCDCECGAYDPDCDAFQAQVDEDDEDNAADLYLFGCDPGFGVTCSTSGTCEYDVRVADDWVCNTSWFGTSDGCDCGCGAVDPDCNDPSQPVYGCAPNVACNAGVCEDGFNPPAEWTCDAEFYGTTDGCDCGCGATDPDCTLLEDSLLLNFCYDQDPPGLIQLGFTCVSDSCVARPAPIQLLRVADSTSGADPRCGTILPETLLENREEFEGTLRLRFDHPTAGGNDNGASGTFPLLAWYGSLPTSTTLDGESSDFDPEATIAATLEFADYNLEIGAEPTSGFESGGLCDILWTNGAVAFECLMVDITTPAGHVPCSATYGEEVVATETVDNTPSDPGSDSGAVDSGASDSGSTNDGSSSSGSSNSGSSSSGSSSDASSATRLASAWIAAALLLALLA